MSMKKNILIKANNLSKSFAIKGQETTVVLSELNAQFYKDEFTAVMGPSGAGKSTLLYLLGSLDKPDSGEINFYSNNEVYSFQNMNDNSISKFRNKHIGFVFQFHHLLPEFTALENVIIPALINKKTKKEASAEAMKLLDIVGVAHRVNHKPAELSGGEQQRIAIARALINKPSLLIADEPTGNLDSANTKSVLALLNKLRKEFSLSVIVATHSHDVADIADNVYVMGDGKILLKK